MKHQTQQLNNPDLTYQTYETLSASNDPEIRFKVAKLPSCPPDLLAKLAKDDSISVQMSVGSNPNCEKTVLKQLAQNTNLLSGGILRNPTTPLSVLKQALASPQYYMDIAQNKNIDLETMNVLYDSADTFIKATLVDNPNIHPTILAKAAYDKAEFVREATAGNKNIDKKLLDKLAEDEKISVRRAVSANTNTDPKTLDKLAEEIDTTILLNLAQNKTTNTQTLDKLYQNHQDWILDWIAQHQNTSQETLLKLYEDNLIVKDFAVKNKNFPKEKLNELATSNNPLTVKTVASSAAADGQLLQKLADHPTDMVKAEVALNPNCDPQTLSELAKTDNELVRRAVAQNRATLPQTLDELAQDEDMSVLTHVAFNKNSTQQTLEKLARRHITFLTDILGEHTPLTTELTWAAIKTLKESKNYKSGGAIKVVINLTQLAQQLLNNPAQNLPDIKLFLTTLVATNKVSLPQTYADVLQNLTDNLWEEAIKHGMLTTAEQITLQKASKDNQWDTPTTQQTTNHKTILSANRSKKSGIQIKNMSK